jgi:choline dehydrogenase-like flavoprotein
MLGDGREVPHGGVIETDVCIVGAGPVGIAVARELSASGLRVCLLESGGQTPDPRVDELNDGETTGHPFTPLLHARARGLGGTSAIWDMRFEGQEPGFRGGPLDEIDFEAREEIPHSGWPFGRRELDAFYARAHVFSGFGPYDYDVSRWTGPGAEPLAAGPMLENSIWQFGKRSLLLDHHAAALRTSADVQVLLHATVAEIETDEAARRVRRLRVATLAGNEFAVAPRLVILATGGIEAARLLLLSDAVQSTGLGNQHDVVGRYFMEHQYLRAGTLVPSDPSVIQRAGMFDGRWVDDTLVMGKLTFRSEVLRRERLLNVAASLLPRHRWYRRMRFDAMDSFVAVGRSLARFRIPPTIGRHVREIIAGADHVALTLARKWSRGTLFRHYVPGPSLSATFGWSAAADRASRFHVFEVILHAEQAPDPGNRLTLTRERDALGCRRTRLHWTWGDIDVRSVERAEQLLADAFASSGAGLLHIARQGGRPHLLLPGLHHHMGATRMHRDPKHGVVDENGRVHGVGNLFITGSSVFPTGGYMNPTLTAIALGIRLADHVKRELRPRAGGPRDTAVATTSGNY